MKKLGNLKLNHLNDRILDERQQDSLKGGACGCGCSGCGCVGWDGSGTIPPSSNSNDSGTGYVAANLSGTLSSGYPS